MVTKNLRVLISVLVLTVAGCTSPTTPTPSAVSASGDSPVTPLPRGTVSAEGITGQTIYVPAYSHIFFRDEQRVIQLAVTLTLHNTDPNREICITGVRFYGSDGQLLRTYIDTPVRLAPFASTGYVVREDDTEGGLGANFLVEWLAAGPVSPPIAEAVMISTISTQGISFTSQGRVLPNRVPPQTDSLRNDCFAESSPD